MWSRGENRSMTSRFYSHRCGGVCDVTNKRLCEGYNETSEEERHKSIEGDFFVFMYR